MPFKSLVIRILTALACVSDGNSIEPCCIKIIDASNGWPVPLVELRTTHQARFVSDNAGVIAFDLPELMNVETWFDVIGHGYHVPKDGFGFEGVRLTPRAGETLVVKVTRELPAKRLGRLTGGGLFAESQKLGKELDWQESGVLGCDSVQNVEHNGRMFWAWGDTTLPRYPLGLFHMLGATTELKPLHSFEPPVRLRYDYFTSAQAASTETTSRTSKSRYQPPRNIAQMPGEGPTWLGGFASLPDKQGRKHLVASYAKIKPPLDTYEAGLCVWNEATEVFERTRVVWTKSEATPELIQCPLGHPVIWDDAAGKKWLLFGDPFPTLQCPADFESWSDPSTWQAITPQATVTIDPRFKAKHPNEPIKPHRGAIAWNDYRKKWITVFTQMGGETSLLGELWYAESDQPTGPWSNAIHVVTHSKYTFYNPQLHPTFTDVNSPFILFEATYTKEFSGTTEATPRHNYNQVLYRLDLDELH